MEAAPTFVALAVLVATAAILQLTARMAAVRIAEQAKCTDEPTATRGERRVDEG